MRPGSFRDAEIPLDDRPIAASQVDAAFARPSDPNVSPPAPLVTPTAGRSRFCGRVWERERWRHVGVESSVCAGRWHAPGRPRSRLRHGPWWSSSRFRWCGTSVGDGRWGVWRRWHGSSFCHGLRTGGGCGHGSGVGDGGAGRGWWSSVCNGRSCRVRQRQGVSDGPTQERRWGKCGSWHRPAVLHRTVPFGTPVSRRRVRCLWLSSSRRLSDDDDVFDEIIRADPPPPKEKKATGALGWLSDVVSESFIACRTRAPGKCFEQR